MAYRNRFQNNHVHRPYGGAKPAAFAALKSVPAPKTYTDADIHVDVVDVSFNDVRKVLSGAYPNGEPMIEYLTEAQARERGFLDEWQKAQPIDEYRQRAND